MCNRPLMCRCGIYTSKVVVVKLLPDRRGAAFIYKKCVHPQKQLSDRLLVYIESWAKALMSEWMSSWFLKCWVRPFPPVWPSCFVDQFWTSLNADPLTEALPSLMGHFPWLKFNTSIRLLRKDALNWYYFIEILFSNILLKAFMYSALWRSS